MDGVAFWCDMSTGVLHPLVPACLWKAVFDAIHSLSHPGIKASQQLISSHFVWSGLTKDVAGWCRDCQFCAGGKVTIQEKTQVETIAVPPARFWHVHADLVGPLPTSKDGCAYLLTIIDRTSRWPEAVPLRGISAVEVADAFTSGWVARFGVPHTVTTDRSTKFTGAVWKSMCATLGIRHVVTTAYHPQSNGLVERFHRQLKEGLRSRAAGAAWLEHLPWVLLGRRMLAGQRRK